MTTATGPAGRSWRCVWVAWRAGSSLGLCVPATPASASLSPPKAVSTQVLCDFPHTARAIPADYLLDLIPPIRPRAFSIASSLLVRARWMEPAAVRAPGEGSGVWQVDREGAKVT